MLDFLQRKFREKKNPTYVLKEIHPARLELSRAEARFEKFATIHGSQKFQITVFKPNKTYFKASQFICLCEKCESINQSIKFYIFC